MTKNGKYIVILDLDKTLLSINSGKTLTLESYKSGLLSTINLTKAIILSTIYKLRLKNPVRITELMVKWLKGVPESSVKELTKQLVKQMLIPAIRPSIIKEIELHKKQGAHIVLLSAALQYVCKPIANYLKIDAIICSSMEIVNGVFTGKPQGQICMEKEKAIQIRKYCFNNSYNLKEAYCYADSFSDRFVMEISGNPICVAPDKKLRKLSEINSWRVIED